VASALLRNFDLVLFFTTKITAIFKMFCVKRSADLYFAKEQSSLLPGPDL